MKITCGTDIIEIGRIKDSIEDMGERFLERVFTKKEIEYCESRRNQKYQHYAGRFAGKEAVFKAISQLLDDKFDIEWKDIEITNDPNGRPYVSILKEDISTKINSIDISISHCKAYATANAMIIIS